ncbi:MAG: DUF4390 domain-containing protein [Acidobacteria bacterium]|nr:DUF4390 domain-containing protein [Acidobacteriota bacterium]
MVHRLARRAALFAIAAALAASSAAAQSAESLRIVPVVHDDEVSVSFELADAYTDDVRASIASGLKTTFTYDVDLRMSVAAWFNRTIASVVVTTSDQFDNLTRRHTMTRTVDGRVVDTLTTDDEAAVGRWLTAVARMPLCKTSKLDPNREYYVQISARGRPNRGSLLGWVSAVHGEATFTFVP